jgi:hypothetical protein
MTPRVPKTSIVLAGMLAAAAFAIEAVAHEGHDHKVMGTVSVVHEQHLEVKTKAGKTTFVLNADTKVLRNRTPIKAADLKVGDRVVVTAAQTKAGMVAKEIRVGANVQAGPDKP